MIFSDGTLRSVKGIISVFNEFSKISVLNISLEKSIAYLAGISDAAKATISQRFAFEFGDLPVKYLGLPLLIKKMRSLYYTPLIDNIKSRINS